jgi:hypothetical protein
MSKEPDGTEWELEIIAEFYRAARLMEKAVWARIDAERIKALDRVSRYSLLKMYLDDSVIEELEAQGEKARARKMRETQRQQFATLLTEFSREALASQNEGKESRDALNSWVKHRHAVRATLTIRYTVFELRVAFLLHGMGIPASTFFARRACARIRYCFPPAAVIPLRSTD